MEFFDDFIDFVSDSIDSAVDITDTCLEAAVDITGECINTTVGIAADTVVLACELGECVTDLAFDVADTAIEAVANPLETAGMVAGGAMCVGNIIYEAARLNPATRLATNLGESLVDNVFRDKVSSPVPGSVVYCELALGYGEHSGIFIDKRMIVHLNGDGEIQTVSVDEFLNRLDGFNTAISIYVSCNDGTPVGSSTIATRAMAMVGKKRDYNLVMDNCHQFTAGCLTGDFENPCNFLWFLKDEANNILGATEWRVWDL